MCFSLALRTPACRSSSRLLKPKLCTFRLVEPWFRSFLILASISGSFVRRAPPSPKVPRFFWMMKLVEVASTQVADLEAVARRVDRLGVVFDHAQPVSVGDLLDGRHVGALSVEMHGDDGPGPGRDRGLDAGRVDAFRLRIAIDEHGVRAGDPDGFGGRKKGVRMCDHFVAGSDAHRHQRQPDRVGAVAGSDGMGHPMERRQLLLELLEHRALNVLAALEHALDVGVDLRLNVLVLTDVPVKPHLHQHLHRRSPV